ncbi:MAG: UDP-N-acetylmuramoyl-tripeptide--D-alanyl-D-alanine ligase [Firmicutes bacterium]|nr:UDP-N-acetylmuramoyl-tripeptide--D-alanyl-D-alanine ligase [Bacillota bacterium]MDI6706316.1 UDP-N-acetylmuramoyl-tripeptide--D-alanyl-D-alanine ligase [Bacillota bacterium]
MEIINAYEIAEAVGGKIKCGSGTTEITGVSTDTRILREGNMFIPLKGERFDGHQFINQAVERGARVLLVEKDEHYGFNGVVVIKVDDTMTALHSLAKWYRNRFCAEFVAVTGSTGKTTTKNMIASVLSKRFSVIKTPGNYNNQIGLPLTIMQMDSTHQAGVIEMGMSSFGEIRTLMEIVRPRVSVITNIGMSHIEKLGSRENILKAKMEIFEGMGENPVAVVNGDDELLRKGTAEINIPVIYFGIESGDYRAARIDMLGERRSEYTLCAEGNEYHVSIPVAGKHNIYNSLAAIAVGRTFGMDFADIILGLEDLEEEKMRLVIEDGPGGIKVINDTYNASPDSMKSALEVLRMVEGRRKIAVLADMLEMGQYAEEGHRMVGRYVAENEVDILITVGHNSKYIAQGAMDRGMKRDCIYCFEHKKDAERLLETLVTEQDVLLFKGSRGMKMEELVHSIQERS